MTVIYSFMFVILFIALFAIVDRQWTQTQLRSL